MPRTPPATQSLLDRLLVDRRTFTDAGWSLDDHYCLSLRDLSAIIEALQSAARITVLYQREITNGYPVTHEEQALALAMHAITHPPVDLTDAP